MQGHAISRKRLGVVGLLAALAMLLIAAVGSASASAAPNWYENGAVLKAAVGVKSKGTLTLTDTKTIIGSVTVVCKGTDNGTIGPEATDALTEIVATSCESKTAGCSSPSAKAVNVAPTLAGGVWQTYLYLEGTEVRDRLTTTSGTKVVGWIVKCQTFIGEVTDECTSPESSTKMTNNATTGDVEATFDAKTPKATCTQSKEKTGEVTGTDIIEKPSGASSIEAK